MTFRELIIQLADRLGRHQVPVHEDAKEIRDFLGHDGVHHELISRVVRTVYRRNRCGHLAAAVDAGRTLDALGPIRADLIGSPHTDICQLRFMDALIREVEQLLCGPEPGKTPEHDASAAAQPAPATPAPVIALRRPSNATRNEPVHQPEGQDRQTGGE